MKKATLIAVATLCSLCLAAQNPFTTKANVMYKFDLSPNGKEVCGLWFAENGKQMIRIKNISTGKTTDIDLSGNDATLCACFLSDSFVVFPKDGAIVKYEIKTGQSTTLFDTQIPKQINIVNEICVANTGEKIYFTATSLGGKYPETVLYVAKTKGGVQHKLPLMKDESIFGLSKFADNGVVYTMVNSKAKTREIMQLNNKNEVWNLSNTLKKTVEKPYLALGDTKTKMLLVVGEGGMFVVDTLTNRSKLVIVNPTPTGEIEDIRLSKSDNMIYYKTAGKRNVIQSVDWTGHSAKSIELE